jgi:hypothetical protein
LAKVGNREEIYLKKFPAKYFCEGLEQLITNSDGLLHDPNYDSLPYYENND